MKINLKSNLQAQLVKINSLDQICTDYLKDKVNNSTRSTCLFYDNEFKCFEMILSKEVFNAEVLKEIKELFEFQLLIFNQVK